MPNAKCQMPYAIVCQCQSQSQCQCQSHSHSQSQCQCQCQCQWQCQMPNAKCPTNPHKSPLFLSKPPQTSCQLPLFFLCVLSFLCTLYVKKVDKLQGAMKQQAQHMAALKADNEGKAAMIRELKGSIKQMDAAMKKQTKSTSGSGKALTDAQQRLKVWY